MLCVYFSREVVSWTSLQQQVVSLSSTKAGYIALPKGAKGLRYVYNNYMESWGIRNLTSLYFLIVVVPFV